MDEFVSTRRPFVAVAELSSNDLLLIAAAAAAITLSAFPDFVNYAQKWIMHLGTLAAPLTGVILADYLVAKRQGSTVPALFDPQGRYRYLEGVNVPAVVAVAIGMAVYYAVPPSWIKVIWGLPFGAAAYLVLAVVQATRDTDPSATFLSPSSPS